MQQPVSEDMPAFGIGPQLRLVQRDEGVFAAGPGHGFGGAEKIARVRRLDPFLAGDQRHLLVALDRADPVIDLARQQSQGKAHHAAGMAAHPLDREVRLAGIGRTEHGAHTRVVGWAGRGGEGHGTCGSVRLGQRGQGRPRTRLAHKRNDLSHP
jgi:hypothetical protein